jgi:hypothetical protein
MTRRLHRPKECRLLEEFSRVENKSSSNFVGAGNIRIHGGKRTSIPNYSVRKLIRKVLLAIYFASRMHAVFCI